METGMGMESMFSAAGTALTVLIAVIAVIIGAGLLKSYRSWSRSNGQPLLSVKAAVVSKRSRVHSQQVYEDGMHHQTHTDYYATFEVESGDRMEFSISGRDFGLLAEGDIGKLTFRGSRYQGFERDNNRLIQFGRGTGLDHVALWIIERLDHRAFHRASYIAPEQPYGCSGFSSFGWHRMGSSPRAEALGLQDA